MKISLVQTDLQWLEVQANLDHIGRMIASAPGADLYVLPEMFSTGFATDPVAAKLSGGAALEWMLATAREQNAAIAGSVALQEDGKYYNRMYFVTPDSRVQHYDKRHLFAIGGESSHYTPGRRPAVVEYMDFRIMLLVCYDLRFPVWSRSAGDCDLLLYSASWPQTRINVWETLLRARAIENQCYVAGVNRTGSDPCDIYDGRSAVIGFKGETLAQVAKGAQTVITALLSRGALDAFRTKFPAWKDADSFTIHK